MSFDLSQFAYTYKDNNAPRTLFLLHGTGGTEHDFLFLDRMTHSAYNLVGLRGNVDEGGAARFFKRLAPGVFDEESIKIETAKLHVFVESWAKIHSVSYENINFLGYSNGANMLLAAVLLYPEFFQTAVYMHPMMPLKEVSTNLNLSTHAAFVSFGLQDSMVSPEESTRVVEVLKSKGALVVAREYQGGHDVSEEELADVVAFLLKQK